MMNSLIEVCEDPTDSISSNLRHQFCPNQKLIPLNCIISATKVCLFGRRCCFVCYSKLHIGTYYSWWRDNYVPPKLLVHPKHASITNKQTNNNSANEEKEKDDPYQIWNISSSSNWMSPIQILYCWRAILVILWSNSQFAIDNEYVLPWAIQYAR